MDVKEALFLSERGARPLFEQAAAVTKKISATVSTFGRSSRSATPVKGAVATAA